MIIWCSLPRIEVYGWIVHCPGHPDIKARSPTPRRLFPVSPGREMGKLWICKLSVIPQELLKREVKLLLSANRNAASISTTTGDLE